VETLIEPLALVILPHREAVGELFEARRLLEPAIAALAARRATRDELGEMERILDEQAKEVAQGRTGVVQDSALHAAIANSAHNRAITRIVNALMDLLTQSREESLHTPGRPTRSHEDHRRILEAIKRRDEVAAHRAMLDHLIAVESLVTGVRTDEARAPASARRARKTDSRG
jgi:GntR family transcriptional repressor for pyruvate dehydrogenase complex